MKVIIFLLICFTLYGCTSSKKQSTSQGDPYGLGKRELERRAKEKSEQILFEQELKKLTKKSVDTIKQVSPTSSRELTPDDAYAIGYDEGYQQGLEDKEEGEDFEAGYDDANDFYNYYDTRYREGYEEGYSVGYEEGEVNQ